MFFCLFATTFGDFLDLLGLALRHRERKGLVVLGFKGGWFAAVLILGGLLPMEAYSAFPWSKMPYCVRALHSQYQHFRLSQNMSYFSEEGRLAFSYGYPGRSEVLFKNAFQALLERQTLMTRFDVSFAELALIENAIVSYFEPDLTLRPTFVGLLLSYVSRPVYREKISFALEGWDKVAVETELESEEAVMQEKQTIGVRAPDLLARLLHAFRRDLANPRMSTEEKQSWCRSRSFLQGIREAEAALPSEDEYRQLSLELRALCRGIVRNQPSL